MDEFKGKLGKYKIIPTDDQSETVWSEYFDEACHNLSGAKDETIHNYINGCQLEELIKNSTEIHLLDVGFGIGMGLICLIDFIKLNPLINCQIHYTSIELDDLFAHWSLNKYLPFLKIKKNSIKNLEFLESTFHNISIKIFLGNGRITLPLAFNEKLIKNFNIIFQDPFSPKKNPDLWTVEWFLFLKNNSSEWVKMATYSASISIRKSMLSAGWIIENHPGFRTKKNMTKASLKGQIDQELLEQLARSPAIAIHDQ